MESSPWPTAELPAHCRPLSQRVVCPQLPSSHFKQRISNIPPRPPAWMQASNRRLTCLSLVNRHPRGAKSGWIAMRLPALATDDRTQARARPQSELCEVHWTLEVGVINSIERRTVWWLVSSTFEWMVGGSKPHRSAQGDSHTCIGLIPAYANYSFSWPRFWLGTWPVAGEEGNFKGSLQPLLDRPKLRD